MQITEFQNKKTEKGGRGNKKDCFREKYPN